MAWRVILAIVLSAIVTSFSDWFFFGVWMHQRYATYPEVWRRSSANAADNRAGENRAVLWSAILYMLTSVCFVGLCAVFGMTTLRRAGLAALLCWLAFPVPTLVTNTLFIKLDARLLLPHGLGWLARLLLTAGIIAAVF